MQLNEIFRETQYSEAYEFIVKNNYVIIEIDSDEQGRRFQIQEIPKPTEEDLRQERICEIKNKLTQLDQDIVQDLVGEFVPNIDERKAEFIRLHNELRILEGKEPRELKE